MAEKVIAIKIDVQGTADQNKKLVGLEKNLKQLKDERTKLNKAVKDGVISTDQYAKSIAKVNLGLKGTQRQLLVTRQEMLGIDGFTTRLGKSFGRLGNQISGAFVGLFALQKFFSVIQDGFNTIKDFEQQMARVKAITGATDEELKKLTNNAKELGKATIFTAEQVGKLQEEYAKLGFSTAEVLLATEATLNLAAATGSDLAESAVIAGSTIRGFGLDASEAGRVTDVMAAAFTGSALDLEKFGVAMSKVAPVAATAGISLEKTTALLGKLTDSGFDASTAGTALRNIFIKLEQNGLTLEESFEKIRNATNPVAEAVELFDVRSASLALTLADNEDAANKFSSSLENAEGSAKDMADTVSDTLQGDITRLGSAWDGLILSIENSEGVFRDVVQGISGIISDLSTTIEDTDIAEKLGFGSFTFSSEFKSRADKAIETYKKVRKQINEASGDTAKLVLIQNGLANEMQKNATLTAQDLKALAEAQKLVKTEIESTAKADADRKTKSEAIIKTLDREREIRKGLAGDFKTQTDEYLTAIIERNKLQLSNLKRQKQEKVLTVELFNSEKDNIQEINKLIRVELSEREKLSKEKDKNAKKDVKDAAAKKALAKKAAADLLKAEDKLIKDSEKLRQEADLLAIKDKQELEEAKINIAAQAREDEINALIVDEDLKTSALLDSEANRIAQIQALKDKGIADEKIKTDKKAVEEEEQRKEIEATINQGKIDVANQLATALVDIAGRKADREKEVELANLNAKLENELISQDEFEKQKLDIEKKAFKKKKALELANIAIALAVEIANIQAAAAANPLNAVTFGSAGLSQAAVLTGVAVAKSAVQAGVVASQSFAEGGYTGEGSGNPDSSGFKQAGVVHQDEYVIPKNVLETPQGSRMANSLEAMRTNRPQPYIGAGFANGGFTSGGGNVDIEGLRDEITSAVVSSIGSIPVINVATETVSQASKVSNIQLEATFG